MNASPDASVTTGLGLPEFDKPPVVEVAVSVHFDQLGGFQPVHFGLLWSRFRERYPLTEYHAPIGSTIELLDGWAGGRMSVEVHTDLPVGRCFFMNEDKTELLQIQPDRLTVNWQKRETDHEYPRYSTIRQRFEAELIGFADFVRELRLGTIQPLQCEVTYVNHIVFDQTPEQPINVSEITTLWSGGTSDAFLKAPTDVRFASQFLIADSEQPRGRLHIEGHPSRRTADGRSLFALHLVGRGAPIGAGLPGVLAFADLAHSWIVRGFTSVTTPQMHTRWERRQ